MSLPHRLRSALRLGGLPPRELASRTRERAREHEVPIRASALAFYAMLASVPSLALILALLVPPPPGPAAADGQASRRVAAAIGQRESTLRTLFPREPYAMLTEQVARLRHQSAGVLVLGAAITLWSAMSLFLIIIDAMNRIYGVAETRSFLRLRLTALVMTLVQAAILLAALAAIVAWPQVLRHLGLGPGGAWA